MVEEIINQTTPPMVEGLKLIKNSRGYNWEIKLTTLNVEHLVELDNKMRAEFGNEVDNV